MTRQVPSQIIDVVEKFEGLRLVAYKDSNGVPTIGYGCTGPEIHMGMEISLKQADAMMLNKLQTFADQVDSVVKVPLNDNQFAALVDFVYNCGIGDLVNHDIIKVINRGDYNEVPKHLALYVHDKEGNVLFGLQRRRQAEIKLWSKPVTGGNNV